MAEFSWTHDCLKSIHDAQNNEVPQTIHESLTLTFSPMCTYVDGSGTTNSYTLPRGTGVFFIVLQQKMKRSLQQSEKNNSCSAELSNSRDPPQKNPTQLHICSFNSQQPASRMRSHVSLPFLGAERGAGYELQLRLLSVQQMQEWCAELS